MKKILVYHLYIFDGFLVDEFMKLHKLCLKDYINVFDESRFVITVNDLNNKSLISDGFKWVSEITVGKKFSIKVKENTSLYEVDTFKEEILDNIDTLRDYVFFAHSKGNSKNISVPSYNKESVMRWVCALYYFSLNFIDEVEDRFCGHGRASEIFYGPLLTQYKDPSVSPMLRLNKNNCFYQGTFYWINMRKLSNYLKEGIVKLPEIDDRYWAEMLPGVICGREEYGDGLASHKDIAITDDFNLYSMNDEEWQFLSNLLGEPDFIQYMSKKFQFLSGK